ncbi:5275_t:CDS:2, partial [Diversispora eburnea]
EQITFNNYYYYHDNESIPIDVKYSTILENHDKYDKTNAGIKYFESGPTLAYVTPWNNHGGHDVDQGWIKNVRVKREDDEKIMGKIVPRFEFHNWNQLDYENFIRNPEEAEALVNVLIKECRDFVRKLGMELHKESRELILVINPRIHFTAAQFEDFSQFVDLFSVMTYDHSSAQNPGPNAPINWVENNIISITPTSINRNKVLLGLNMYGIDFYQGGKMDYVIRNNYIDKLRYYKPKIEWNYYAGEHSLQYEENGVSHEVWFPTLKSIKTRIEIAEDYGTGLSLWEIGQGLDYFK